MEEWRAKASCEGAGDALFFDESRHAEAQRICASCPVRAECLNDILRWEWEERGYYRMLSDQAGRNGLRLMFGVFGGMTPEDRWRFVQSAAGLDARLDEVYALEEIDHAGLIDRARQIWEESQ